MKSTKSFSAKEWKIAIPLKADEESHDAAYWKGRIGDMVKMGARRVFLTISGNGPAVPVEYFKRGAGRISEIAALFRKAGIEWGIWLGHTIGHGGCGASLSGLERECGTFTHIVGGNADGSLVQDTGCLCPLDANFQAYICKVLAALAETRPPILMIDDDYRLAFHEAQFGCFCKLHLAKVSERLGRKITAKEIASGVKTNLALRRVWREVNGDSLAELAGKMEQAVHDVSPNTRFGACTGTFGFAMDGMSQARLTQIMTGKGGNRPFMRACFAPYWSRIPNDVGWQIEAERLQAAKVHETLKEAEVMAEGDTYPHTTFAATAASLEAFHEGLETSGFESVLSYQFNYGDHRASDLAFANIIAKNRRFHEALRKTSPPQWREFGFEPVMHYDGFLSFDPDLSSWEDCWNLTFPPLKLLPRLGIPIAFGNPDMPVVLCTEECNAFSDSELQTFLKRGAVIDGPAAEVLLKRGFDLGISNLTRSENIPEAEICDGVSILLRTGGSHVYWTYSAPAKAKIRTSFSNGMPGVVFIRLKNDAKIAFLPWNMRKGDFWFNLQFCTQTVFQDAFNFLYGQRLPARLNRRADVRLHCRVAPDGKEMAICVQNISLDDFRLADLVLDEGISVTGGLLPNRTAVTDMTALPAAILHPLKMAVIKARRCGEE